MIDLPQIISLIKDYSGPVAGAMGGIAGWFGNQAKNKLQAQRNTIDADALENEHLRLALERERYLTDRIIGQEGMIQRLWDTLAQKEEVLRAHSAALTAARMRVHELEAQQGLPLTKYPPVLSLSPLQENSGKAPHKAEDQAAGTADPGGQNTHS